MTDRLKAAREEHKVDLLRNVRNQRDIALVQCDEAVMLLRDLVSVAHIAFQDGPSDLFGEKETSIYESVITFLFAIDSKDKNNG